VRRRPAAISRAARSRVSNDRSRRGAAWEMSNTPFFFDDSFSARASLSLALAAAAADRASRLTRARPLSSSCASVVIASAKTQAESAWQQRARESFYATAPPRVAAFVAQWATSRSAPFGESLRYTEGAPSEPDVARIGVRL
jgi:hypothetical protein